MADKKQAIIIMTDTQRWDMLNCYRETGLKTPNLDRMAKEGMLCSRAYTCQPVCGPARSAIFTGTYPHTNGSWANCIALGDNVRTIGQRLSDEGIKCGYIGKWHLDGGDYFGTGKCPEGWDADYWYDMRCYLEELEDEERLKSRNSNLMAEETVADCFTFGSRVAKRAVDFLNEYKDEDFLLVVSFDEPHHPYLCPNKYYEMYKDYEFPSDDDVYDSLKDKPDHQKTWAGDRLKEARENYKFKDPAYFGCNSYADALAGRVLDAADKMVHKAFVIYTADHGSLLASHRLEEKGPAPYDTVARIPFIVKCNGKIKASSVNENPISHINITPTILEYMGVEIPKVIEGKSVLGELYGGKRTNGEVFIEFSRYEVDHDAFGGFQPLRAVFDGRFKLCINLMCQDELYDLQDDPYELNNLVENETYKTIRNDLHDKIIEWMNETRDPFRGYWWRIRSWREDAQPATWSNEGFTRQRDDIKYEPRQLDYDTGMEISELVRKKS